MVKKEVSYFTIPEFAKILGVRRVSVFNMVKKGKIQAVRFGRNYAIEKRFVDEIMGKSVSEETKLKIDDAVKRTVSEYGEVLRKLGRE